MGARMVEAFNTNHTYLVCPNNVLTELLEEALLAKDLPGMADVDASLLYFCREVKKIIQLCFPANVRTKYSAVIHGLGRRKRLKHTVSHGAMICR